MPTTPPLRVLEIGSGIAAAYAARLLADQGADVVKVEPPEGDPARRLGPFADDVDEERSGLFLAVNVNKRGICLNFQTPAGRAELSRLIGWANVVVHSLGTEEASFHGLDPDAAHASRPDLIVLAMTPFGLVGPYAHFAASELTLSHGGGWAGLCPMAHPEPSYPPLKMHGHHCSLMAGVAGAMSVLAVARDRARCGVGEYIDFSVLAYVASVLEFGIHIYTYHGFVIKRTVPRSLIPWRIFDTKDGAIFLACIEQDQWERLVAFMGNPDWATLDVFATPAGRNQNQDVIHRFLEEFRRRLEDVRSIPRRAAAPDLLRTGDDVRESGDGPAPRGSAVLHDRAGRRRYALHRARLAGRRPATAIPAARAATCSGKRESAGRVRAGGETAGGDVAPPPP